MLPTPLGFVDQRLHPGDDPFGPVVLDEGHYGDASYRIWTVAQGSGHVSLDVHGALVSPGTTEWLAGVLRNCASRYAATTKLEIGLEHVTAVDHANAVRVAEALVQAATGREETPVWFPRSALGDRLSRALSDVAASMNVARFDVDDRRVVVLSSDR